MTPTVPLRHTPTQLHDSRVLAAVEVQLAQEAVLYIVQHVAIHCVGRPLPLQLEHQHPAIMACRHT